DMYCGALPPRIIFRSKSLMGSGGIRGIRVVTGSGTVTWTLIADGAYAPAGGQIPVKCDRLARLRLLKRHADQNFRRHAPPPQLRPGHAGRRRPGLGLVP